MAVTKKGAPIVGAGGGVGVKRKGVGSGAAVVASATASATKARSTTATAAAASSSSSAAAAAIPTTRPDLLETARCLQLASDRLECVGTRNAGSINTNTSVDVSPAFSLPSAQKALDTAVDRLDAMCRRSATEQVSESLAYSQSDSLQLGLLLPYVSTLRKTAMRTLLGKVAHIRPEEASNGVLLETCRVAVVGCMVFLIRLLDFGVGKVKEKEEVKGDGTDAGRLVGTFVESAMFCVKGWIASSSSAAAATTKSGGGEKKAATDSRVWQSALDEMRVFVLRLRERALHGLKGGGKGQIKELDVLLVKISHLYTAAFMKRKATDDRLDEFTIAFLAHSIAAVKQSLREIKDQASYTTKLEKLGAIYEKSNRLVEASKIYDDAVNYQLEIGALTLATKEPSHKSPAHVLGQGGKAEVLGRTLWGYVRVSTKIARSDKTRVSWWDNEKSSAGERGLVLEWQLEYLCNHLEIDHDRVEIAIKGIIKLLGYIYKPESFFLRRKRLIITVFQIKDADLGVYDEGLEMLGAAAIKDINSIIEELDVESLDAHYTATILAFQALRDIPNVLILENALQIWETVVQGLEEVDDIKERIDNFSLWVTQLKAMSDFFDMKGTANLRIRSLEVLTKSIPLLCPVDEDLLVSTHCKLGHQFLKIGNSGKAGLVLAKAQKLLTSSNLATATKLEWNLAYAEYLLLIGNQEQCGNTLSQASEIAEADERLSSTSQYRQTMSERIRTNSLLSEASYLVSVNQFQRGHLQDALRHAKGCVSLNQRNWVNLESKWHPKEQHSLSITKKNNDNFNAPNTTRENINSMATSIAPESLTGAAFWTLVPSLVKCFSHLAEILLHHGLFQESVHYLERAEKIASTVGAEPYLLSICNALVLLYARSNRLEKAQTYMVKANSISANVKPSIHLVDYYLSMAHLCRSEKRVADEMVALERAADTLDTLMATSSTKITRAKSIEIDSITETLSGMALDEKPSMKQKLTSSRKGTRLKKEGTTTVIQKAEEQTCDRVKKPQHIPKKSQGAQQTCLDKISGSIQRQKALCLLRQGYLEEASKCLTQVSGLPDDCQGNIEHKFSLFRKLLAQGMEELASDFTFNCLPESTLSFPATLSLAQPPILPRQNRRTGTSPRKAATMKKTSSVRKQTTLTERKQPFTHTLYQARECLGEIYATTLSKCSTWLMHQVYKSMCQITMLLSAASAGMMRSSLQPCSVAYSLEAARNCAVQREHDIYRSNIVNKSSSDKQSWPTVSEECAIQPIPSLSQFQTEFIDIIPETWSAISISLNEACDELYMARYDAKQPPFVLRLPLTRQASREFDDDDNNDDNNTFGFEEAKTELLEIIQLSTFSTHNANEVSSKAAKKAWWSEREALDRRLQSLLQNIENIWMGGFRGIFSQHPRWPELLARFQKSLEAILERYLPSRQKAVMRKSTFSESNVTFDPRILELFVGLGDPNSEDVDLDEPLMDLLHYVVDILQYNGERNAIDEIDFDSMVIETNDALKYYHSCTTNAPASDRHIILILDKHLHSFPWESLSCLEGLSISRLPSLLDLQRRIKDYNCNLNYKKNKSPRGIDEGHIVNVKKGTSILNPSGDLSQTQKVFEPILQTLPSDWDHIAARIPTQTEFSKALTESDLILYFGHGSGAQYLPNSVLRKSDTRAVTWLMGCSSGAVTENGEFEPHGTVLNYLMAGAPAVLATLWDVTDKDCDRFSMKCGEIWGLWEENMSEKIEMPKRPAGRREKGDEKRRKKEKKTISDSVDVDSRGGDKRAIALDEAIMRSRDACYLRYLNGAAPVLYGIPSYLG